MTVSETIEKQPASPSGGPVKRRRSLLSRAVGAVFWLLVCGGVLVFFLPQLAARLCHNDQTVAWITGTPQGTFHIGEASLGWLASVRVSGVTMHSGQGQPIATVQEIATSASLWDMLSRRQDSLRLTLTGLKLSATIPNPRPAGRLDLNEMTRALQSCQVPDFRRPMDVTCRDAEVDFLNESGEVVDSWKGISGEYHCGADGIQTAQVVVPAAEDGGSERLQLHVEKRPGAEYPRAEVLTLDVTSRHLPLVAVEPWLTTYLGPEHGIQECNGTLRGTFQRDVQTGWSLTATAQASTTGGPPQNAATEAAALPAALELETSYSAAADELSIPRLRLAGGEAALSVRGKVAEVSGRQLVDVLADVSTPGSSPLDLVPLPIREQVQVEGLQLSQISIQGPLAPRPDGPASPFQFSLIASWKSVAAYGLVSNDGQLRITLRDGQVSAQPLDVVIGGGRLRQLPALDLRTSPPELHFQAGPVLENVQLTEDVCRGWLKFISPTLANATSADGRLTLIMKECRVPVGEIAQGNLSGTVIIHHGRVGPGPLAKEVLLTANQLQDLVLRGQGRDLTQQTWMVIREEDVSFRLADGRVEHDEFAFYVGDMRIWTTGSVGLDQSLNLLLTLEIPDKWLQTAGPVLQAFRGERIQLLVRGTLDQPRIDASPLADFGKRIGIKAGAGLLERILERRIQRGR